MLALFAFIFTIIGCLNWLCIGFFQFDFIAGLFGTQSSIFSRLIYIIFGICSVFLTYAVIRYKGRLTIKKNKNQDAVLLNKQPAPQNLNDNVFTNNIPQNNPNGQNSTQTVTTTQVTNDNVNPSLVNDPNFNNYNNNFNNPNVNQH